MDDLYSIIRPLVYVYARACLVACLLARLLCKQKEGLTVHLELIYSISVMTTCYIYPSLGLSRNPCPHGELHPRAQRTCACEAYCMIELI